MLAMMLTMAMISQDSEYLDIRNPEPGEKLVLASKSSPTLYVAANYSFIMDLDKALKAKDEKGVDDMLTHKRIAIVRNGTAVLYIKRHEYKSNNEDWSEVRMLDGPFKDQAVYVHTVFCKMIDPVIQEAKAKAEAEAREWAEKKAKRVPLNDEQIVKDLQAAIKKARADAGRLAPLQAKQQKEKIMKAAIDGVRKKHVADLDEVNAIATKAKVFITFDGQKYDVAGNKLK